MSSRIRGTEATIRVSVDGQVQDGSLFNVNDWMITPDIEISKKRYCGDKRDTRDIQVNGFDFSFSVDAEDAKTLDFLTTIIEREDQNKPHPKIVLTVQYAFRKPGVANRVEILFDDLFMKEDSHGPGSAKEYVSSKFSGGCKQRKTVTA